MNNSTTTEADTSTVAPSIATMQQGSVQPGEMDSDQPRISPQEQQLASDFPSNLPSSYPVESSDIPSITPSAVPITQVNQYA